MRYTKQQEEQYLKNNSKAVWKIVNRFHSTSIEDDLYQEGMMALLEHLRSAKNEEELMKFPTMSIKNAVCRCIMSHEPVSIPSTRTTDYSKTVSRFSRISFADWMSFMADPMSDEDIWIERIDMRSFIDRLSERDRDMILSKASGSQTTELAKKYGITPGAVTHVVQRQMKRYLNERKIA